MPMQIKLGYVNRIVAAIIALVWAFAGIAGLLAGYILGRWAVALAGLFALWYAFLWIRVVARGRVLTWSEIAVPWRALNAADRDQGVSG